MVITGRLSGWFSLRIVASKESAPSSFRFPVIKTRPSRWQVRQINASHALSNNPRVPKRSTTNPRSFQKSRQVSDVQIATRASRCPTTLMSARMPRILLLPHLGLAALSDHGQEPFVASVEHGLELGRVPAADALHVLLV